MKAFKIPIPILTLPVRFKNMAMNSESTGKLNRVLVLVFGYLNIFKISFYHGILHLLTARDFRVDFMREE